MSNGSLEGKVVLLTGGSGFLGKHFAGALTEAGATVVAADIQSDAVIQIDVTDQASIDAAFDSVVEEHGGIDVVVNSAAIDPKFDPAASANDTSFVNYPEEAMQQSVDVNLLGTWRVCKAAVRHLQGKGGVIVNVSSIYGTTPPRQEIYPEGTEKPVDYPITKAGIVMLTQHIAAQFGRDNIRCNALAPGGVFKGHDDAFVERYSEHTSLGRMNTPEEVADALVFLCSDASRGMTGEVLQVDAGWRSR